MEIEPKERTTTPRAAFAPSRLAVAVGVVLTLLAWIQFNLSLTRQTRSRPTERAYINWYKDFEERSLLFLSAESGDSLISSDQELSKVTLSIRHKDLLVADRDGTPAIPIPFGPVEKREQLKQLIRLLGLLKEGGVFRYGYSENAAIQIRLNTGKREFVASLDQRDIGVAAPLQLLLRLYEIYSHDYGKDHLTRSEMTRSKKGATEG